jgi:hypothetical protein
MIQYSQALLLVFTLAFAGWTHSLKSLQAEQVPAEFELQVVPADIALGSATGINLLVKPQAVLTDFQVSIADPDVWVWKKPFDLQKTISTARLLNASIVPERLGEQTPAIFVDFMANGQPFHEYVQVASALEIKNVSDFISFKIASKSGTVAKNDEVNFRLTISNSSPFQIIISDKDIHGYGIDLDWTPPTAGNATGMVKIDPGNTELELKAKVTGEHPHPQLSVDYSWIDASGSRRTGSQPVTGDEISLAAGSNWISNIPETTWGIIIGVFAGLLGSLVTDFAIRIKALGANRRQVAGMINLVTLELGLGADRGTAVDMGFSEELLKKEEFYHVIKHFDLLEDVKDVWKTATKFNQGLNSPGNIQREKDLKKAAEQLKNNQGNLAQGWIRYKLGRLLNRTKK